MFAACVWGWGNDVQPPSRKHGRKLQAPCGLRNRRNNWRPGRAYRLDSLAHIRIHENTIPSPTPPTSTNDHRETKWRPNKRTRSTPPSSSPRASGRYRTRRRRRASTTLLRTSPSPRRYVRDRRRFACKRRAAGVLGAFTATACRGCVWVCKDENQDVNWELR